MGKVGKSSQSKSKRRKRQTPSRRLQRSVARLLRAGMGFTLWALALTPWALFLALAPPLGQISLSFGWWKSENHGHGMGADDLSLDLGRFGVSAQGLRGMGRGVWSAS